MTLTQGSLISLSDFETLETNILNFCNRRKNGTYSSSGFNTTDINALTTYFANNPTGAISSEYITQILTTLKNFTYFPGDLNSVYASGIVSPGTKAYELSPLTTIVDSTKNASLYTSDCNSSCMGLCAGCSDTCTGSCTGTCTTTCTGTCTDGCQGSCKGSCKGCSGSCSGCSGCSGGCSGCSGNCGGCWTGW